MSYIDGHLMNGESVVYRTKLHWAIFVWPVVWLVIAIILVSRGEEGTGAAGLFFLIAIASGIVAFMNYASSEFGITNKRVIVKVGLIRRKSTEVLLSKVEGIQVDQSILGRVLGFGSITVTGTGGTKDPFHKIDAPFEFRKKAQEQIAAMQDQK